MSAVLSDDGTLNLFVVNRSMDEDLLFSCDLRSFGDVAIKEHILLSHPDVNAVNTEANPNNVVPTAGEGGKVDGGKLEMRIPKLSWNVIRVK